MQTVARVQGCIVTNSTTGPPPEIILEDWALIGTPAPTPCCLLAEAQVHQLKEKESDGEGDFNIIEEIDPEIWAPLFPAPPQPRGLLPL